jgi:hypothetical protein
MGIFSHCGEGVHFVADLILHSDVSFVTYCSTKKRLVTDRGKQYRKK